MKVSKRRCISCRKVTPKYELLRLVFCNDQVVLDRLHKLPGRGAYIHDQLECWSKVAKQQALLARALKRSVLELNFDLGKYGKN